MLKWQALEVVVAWLEPSHRFRLLHQLLQYRWCEDGLDIFQTQLSDRITCVVVHATIVAHAHWTPGVASRGKFYLYAADVMQLEHELFIGVHNGK